MAYFNGGTILTCPPNINSYVQNLTASYANKSNESILMATSVVMFIIADVFFIFNLFSRVSEVSSVLNPTARVFLSGARSLFIPVMSYLFSEAKKDYMVESGDPNIRDSISGLSAGARKILTWMLLVELLRKEPQANLDTEGMQWYKGIFKHAATIVWLGYLVFFNLKGAGAGLVPVFGFLWLICAIRLVQRIVFAELAKRSFAYGKNARLLSSYMAQMLHGQAQNVQANASERLKMCKYAVMGEENLVLEAGPRGYELDLDNITKDADVVTVGKIWQLTESAEIGCPLFKSNPRFKRLCLSFALFKLLRRRFEHLPAMTREETGNCGGLIFEGLCREGGVSDPEVALFQVINDEVNFLCEYYHSVHPVVLASPYFLVVNYIVVFFVLCSLCVMITILSGNGDMSSAFRSIRDENYAVPSGMVKLIKCLLENVFRTRYAFFLTIDILISYLLFISFILELLREFIIFVLSNWFMVSLLCTYITKPRWRCSPTIRWAIRCISCVSCKLSHPSLITFRQFSVLSVCWFSMTLPKVSLPKQAKRSIIARFRCAAYGASISNGQYTLDRLQYYRRLSWSCESDSVAEIILTWHIATSLLELEMAHREQKGGSSRTDHRRQVVAMRLSKYCAYLVAFHPELLPDNWEGTERVYKKMKKDLKKALGSWGYHFSRETARHKKMMMLSSDCRGDPRNVVQNGIALGKELIADKGRVWELLSDLWVELIVYVAPSGSDEHVKGHEKALVQGAELVTLLWALATHTGISRRPPPPPTVVVRTVEDGICHG